MRIIGRIFAAIAVVGYVLVGFRALPFLWEQVGAMVTICVGLSLAMTVLIFLHDALVGRSIFEGRS